ncbi:hypothetical protein [Catenulispora subtropica]|uniref:Uncharacterized protein n=1 Tax=Catenulispora subtropica TaxID=450798 RepID=A0ABN2T7Y9_9ACTN
MSDTAGRLLLMLKPDGYARRCTGQEAQTVRGAWSDVIAWLQGVDPDDLAHAELVGEVAKKAGLRMVRFPEYDLRVWVEQAAGISIPQASPSSQSPALVGLDELAAELLEVIGFVREADPYRGWLNRVTIEMLYGDAPTFQTRTRDRLISLLLQGPVQIQTLLGTRRELALALKFVVRRALSSSALSNMVHIEAVTEIEHDLIGRSLVGCGHV